MWDHCFEKGITEEHPAFTVVAVIQPRSGNKVVEKIQLGHRLCAVGILQQGKIIDHLFTMLWIPEYLRAPGFHYAAMHRQECGQKFRFDSLLKSKCLLWIENQIKTKSEISISVKIPCTWTSYR